MHAGLPVVTTAAGGPLEILDESCGVLVPAKDAVSPPTGLETLMEKRELASPSGGGSSSAPRSSSAIRPHQLRHLHALIIQALDPTLFG